MFPGNAEFVARERHQDLLREAEHRRLIKIIEAKPSSSLIRFQQVIYWIGAQLVTLGLKLQGQYLPSSNKVQEFPGLSRVK